MSNLDEWRRLAAPDDRAVPPHLRSKGPASAPAQRVAELASELSRMRSALGEAVSVIETLTIDNQRYHSFSNSFGGRPMGQHEADLMIWNDILDAHAGINAVFELGTWMGGFSLWLWAQCQIRGLEFFTFDAVQHMETPPPCFERLDIFAERASLGERMRALEPIILFCDNGNKPREVKEFSQELRNPQSIIAAHDWMTEFMPTDIPDNLQEIHVEYCEVRGSVTRFMCLRSDDA